MKRSLLIAAACLAAAPLVAGFLPFMLDPPKHSNKVDPLNPENLNRNSSNNDSDNSTGPTPSPTTTPCASCAPNAVLFLPASGSLIQVPGPAYWAGGMNVGNATDIYLTIYFDQDMDLSSYAASGAISFSPACTYSYYAFDNRRIDISLSTRGSTTGGGAGWNMTPLKLASAYTLNLSSAIRSVSGMALVPAAMNFSTGGFKMVQIGYYNSPVFDPNYAEAFFNATLDSSTSLSGKFTVSPGTFSSVTYDGYETNRINFPLCNGSPSTAHTFNYAGGLMDIDGNVSPALLGLTLTSSPLTVNLYCPTSSSSSLSVNFNYAMNTTVTTSAITISPLPLSSVNWSNYCTSGSAYWYSAFTSGVTYTVTVSSTAQSLAGPTLSSTKMQTFIMP